MLLGLATRAGSFFRRFMWLIIVAAAILIVSAIVDRSHLFQICLNAHYIRNSGQISKESIGDFFWIRWWCTGAFIDGNGVAITAFATVVMALFTATLFFTSRDQLRELKRSVDVLAQSERAFLFVIIQGETIRNVVEFLAQDPPGDPIGPLQVVYSFINYGKTPAIIKSASAKLKCSDFPDDELRYWPNDLVVREGAIESGDGMPDRRCYLDRPLDCETAQRIQNGDITIWFYGNFLYEDLFGASHEHRFLWGYNGQFGTFRSFQYKDYNQNT